MIERLGGVLRLDYERWLPGPPIKLQRVTDVDQRLRVASCICSLFSDALSVRKFNSRRNAGEIIAGRPETMSRH